LSLCCVHLSSIISRYRHRDTHKSVSYSSSLFSSSLLLVFLFLHLIAFLSLSLSPLSLSLSLRLFFRGLFANTKAKEKKKKEASKQTEYTIAVHNNEGVKSKLVVHRFAHISIRVNNDIVSIIFAFIILVNTQS